MNTNNKMNFMCVNSRKACISLGHHDRALLARVLLSHIIFHALCRSRTSRALSCVLALQGTMRYQMQSSINYLKAQLRKSNVSSKCARAQACDENHEGRIPSLRVLAINWLVFLTLILYYIVCSIYIIFKTTMCSINQISEVGLLNKYI